MSDIAISSAVKKYGAVQVLHGIDVDIQDGEFVVLVGPSGCGKSTLLRMIAGLENISGGNIAIGGEVVNDLRPKERGIAMVFQNYALYPHMTVAENMGFALRLSKLAKDEIDAKVREAAEILDLGPLLARYPRQLSGGQRQRVAMGRAIVRDPSVFLFDEPLSNLDAKLRVKMRTEIKALHQKLKTTIVYVTHDQIEAMTMADKIVVLEGGHVSQVGSPLELYDNPSNRFVATFIGSPSMNLLPATTRDGTGLTLGNGQDVAVPHQLASERAVDYGIRPEHLTVGAEGEGFAAEVMVVEPTGSETHVICDLNGTEVVAALRDRVTYQPGDTIWLVPDLERSHLFCQDSGQVLH
ncbi:carbohydrate ABC transporter ATP-binding protein, CUT1 family (TC 3.A.1.1.-) [Aliiroseovarius halocynthiae]|uniref:sn-glycerol-3-phosphate ABC transporter ATP-binding protein UgpC n=1 Tax=Aliiroseovarius halocynthiae TaxID=985055 RepID=A0A545SL51_9RHOB|nr:sn-glycerol-3-phosphate ABC transporter ATP-binding protein UgpC [Aliiroseovarius halocynthiae]TQV65707.1 sn-glycerol-3-phosphate ABC transporter ATP-binding protein UgpC [Aliiroseovarius halocynthiae]SMR83944.1 carbohydrate ABC transporter ATP-binding protein, CUT1 family (TC 3.A.1.1.-) [Aliiroseovarius halocynthiae]